LGETIRRRTAIPDGERFDYIEYERRMRDLLAHPAERINGTGLHKLDSHDGNIAISRKPGFGDLEGQLEEGFRDVVDLANGADHSGRELEEEEIGVHAIPPKVGPFPHIIRAAQFASRMAYRKGQFPRLLSLSPVEKSYWDLLAWFQVRWEEPRISVSFQILLREIIWMFVRPFCLSTTVSPSHHILYDSAVLISTPHAFSNTQSFLPNFHDSLWFHFHHLPIPTSNDGLSSRTARGA